MNSVSAFPEESHMNSGAKWVILDKLWSAIMRLKYMTGLCLSKNTWSVETQDCLCWCFYIHALLVAFYLIVTHKCISITFLTGRSAKKQIWVQHHHGWDGLCFSKSNCCTLLTVTSEDTSIQKRKTQLLWLEISFTCITEQFKT